MIHLGTLGIMLVASFVIVVALIVVARYTRSGG
jgi:hypothetical protein